MKKSITLKDTDAAIICGGILCHIYYAECTLESLESVGKPVVELRRRRMDAIRLHDRIAKHFGMPSYEEATKKLAQQINMFLSHKDPKTIN